MEIIREAVGTDKMESKIFDGPIWIQAKQVSKYFKDNIMASYTIRDSNTVEHRSVYNWPLAMFEELAKNCILHKEYENNYIGIYVYSDKITFVNHNRPKLPVTIENMNRSFDDRQYLNEELKDMFFSLDLIESYGSGIRRAKDAVERNNSSELKFLPDNDVDDYTMAVAYINGEFVKTRDEEKRKQQLTSNSTPNNNASLQEKILELIKEDKHITKKVMVEKLGISMYALKKELAEMSEKHIAEYLGYSRKGEWVVYDKFIKNKRKKKNIIDSKYVKSEAGKEYAKQLLEKCDIFDWN